ncbi:hypothetical protein quinque_007207 [Culex quinquefasciatus]
MKSDGKFVLVVRDREGMASYELLEKGKVEMRIGMADVAAEKFEEDTPENTVIIINLQKSDGILVKITDVQEPAKTVTTAEKPIVIPNYSSMISLDTRFHLTNQPPVKPSLWLGETLDTASIADGVDRTTGQLSFTLPIIDLRSKFGVPIRHTFYFNQPEDGTGVDPGMLGKYWSRSMDFIYVDRKDTVFEDEFEYFLVSDGTKVKLEWKGSHSFVEIDHVRLSPLDFSFRAIIFDEFRNNPIAVLRHNGRTVQYLYDSYGRKIGEVDERGSVTKLVIYSKQPAQNDVSSIVNLQPVSGFVEKIKQNPFGKVEEMWYTPKDKHNFTVRLRYNAAGNMVSMDSKFLKEDLDYEAGKGYNANNAGDGSILRTTFEAKWHDKCNRKLLRISISELIKSELKFSVASKCIDELRKKGYVDEASSPFKTMRKEIAGDPCLSGSTFRKLSSILIGKAFPRKYGHAYDYGSHGEMTVAKYFAGSEDPAVNILGNRMTMIADACPGDVESFDIDPNGNHKLLYTGNVRHKLTYKKHTNQIETVQLGANGKAFTFAHNSEGNVISAEYKNIISLEYDHVVDRVSKITMKGGTTIDLGYDIRGERTFKKVTTPSGKIIETYYIRDIKARCLMDMKLVYQDRSMKKPLITLTTYIHGPLGLLGFIRNNVFYSVIADHEGSTRLVVKNGEVVAAYDYLPYGGRMRFYNSDPEGYVAYQYTGQEFDEETGLYNYHARLYDPELGRFYQTDPKEEYPSPYKYAGNSPVMMTDPDGELALTVVCVITAIVGAYLAASASSNSWDPIKWNWKSGQMWLAMIGGTFAGAMLPIGAVETFSIFASIGGTLFASAATASLMMAGTYLGMAGASNDFNPANWDLSSPALYSGMLNGASLAINIPSGAVGITRAISTVSTSKTVYATAIFGTSLLFGYGSAFLENDMTWNPAQWDWNAQTVFAVFEGATFVFMETGAFIKRGPQKALFNHRYPGISTAPSKRWVKRFEQSECQYEVIQDGLQDETCKIRWRQILTGSTDSISPAIPPPGLTKQFIAGLPEVKELSATIHSLTNCIAMNPDRSFYECFQSTAKVLLFAQNLSLESGSIPTGIDRCVPLHWHGQPSVGCQGQQFGFIYTPYEATKMFSFLDGWLMLARVGLQVVENWRQVEEKMGRVCWDEEDVGKYYEQLGEIEKILNQNKRESFKWAKVQLEEMRTDLEEFKSRRSITGLAKMVFEEKLAALREDLLEEIKYDANRINL